MPNTDISTSLPRLGHTYRRDPWWVSPALVFTVLSSFVIYTTWAAFQGEHSAPPATTMPSCVGIPAPAKP
jgi:hypothetical protein